MSPRRPRLLAIALVLSLFSAGCLHQPTELLEAGDLDGPRPGGAAVPWTTARMGATIVTARGNQITVHGFDPEVQLPDGVRVAAADVEACAGQQNTAVSPEYFLLEVQGEDLRPPADVKGRLKDSLQAQPVARRQCARGWVAFELEAMDEPVAVLLASSSFIRWERRPAVR